MYSASRFGLVPREQAFAELAQIAEEQPGNVSLAETLVRVYRDEWTSLEAADRSQRADRVMDRLVAAAPNNIDTYLARYRYRTRYGLPGVDADIAELQQRGPQESRVLAAAAEWAMKCQRPEEARQHYQALLQRIPNSPLGCLGLGEALATLGDSAKALEVWRRGLAADPTNVPINFRIAETLLQRGDLAAAAVPIDSLEQTISRMAAQPGAETNDTVRALRPAVDLLRAQWLLSQGQESAAEGQLQRIVNAGSDQVRQDSTALPTLQAWLLLGERYSAQSRWDQAAAAYQSAAELAPDNSAARLGAAVALGALGQFDPAIRHCRELLAKKNPPPRTYIELARLEWRRQMSLPAEQRQSQTVQEALSAAETAADNWELRLLRADVLAAAGTSDATEQAVAVLKAAEQAYSDVAPSLAAARPSVSGLGAPDRC